MARLFSTAGNLRIRPLVSSDRDTLHRWVTDPHAKFWGELDSTLDDVAREIARLATAPDEAGWIIERAGTPLALIEVYDPANSPLAKHVNLQPGDIGMHLLCAPPTGAREKGLTSALMAATLAWIFAIPRVAGDSEAGAVIGGSIPQRVIVEPDVRNTKIHAKNALGGFRVLPGCASVDLGDKHARLEAVSASGFVASVLGAQAGVVKQGNDGGHLIAPGAQRAHRDLLAKALREFIHERLIGVSPAGEGRFRTELGGFTIEFAATVHPLEHYRIDPDSITAVDGSLPDLVDLIARGSQQLGIPPEFVHTYVEEIASTLAGRARVESMERPTVTELVDAATFLSPGDYLNFLESAMFEGHPGFVANSGRAGMSEEQMRAYVPEVGSSTVLVWVATRRSMTTVAAVSGLNADALISEHIPGWEDTLRRLDLDPADYVPLPLHPWQWENKVLTAFAASILRKDLVYLGTGPDVMHPQQSLRTFFNLTRPEAPYVKTAIAVRNMGFTRGLSPEYMRVTPAINEWLGHYLDEDEDYLRCNVRLLKEIASIGFTGDIYHRSTAAGVAEKGPYHKMIAGLWRESPIPMLGEGSLAVTLAAVLHVDADGHSLAAEWIRRSGLGAQQWARQLLRVYLRPNVRALAEYDIAFMPHAENTILELRDNAPVGAFFKDLGEEVAVVRASIELPEEVSRIQADFGSFTDETRALSIHTDIFDGVLRHLGGILTDAGLLDDATFWSLVRECIEEYWDDYPDSGRHLPLLAEDFEHSCLNRLQLRNPHTMVNLADQNSSLLYAGRIANPAAAPHHGEQ